jgi:PAS domain S-box-containing protein
MQAMEPPHFSFLQTLHEINRLIVRSTHPQTMLQQSCELLVSRQEYRLAWIGKYDDNNKPIPPIALAGFTDADLELISDHIGGLSAYEVLEQGNPIFIQCNTQNNQSWQILASQVGCGEIAMFPLKFAGQTLGVLGVCVDDKQTLSQVERELLEDLAEDLAYALVNLETRDQQAVLQTAAETMKDGLLISDLRGNIIYVNSIVAETIGKKPDELIGKNRVDILPPSQFESFPNILRSLLKQKQLSVEFAVLSKDGQSLVVSMNASLVEDERGKPQYIVTNFRNITSRREYEHQLLALNLLTTNLVQIHDYSSLLNAILLSSEELLHADASTIYILDDCGRMVIDTMVHNVPEEYVQRIARDYRGLPGEAASRTEKPVAIADTLGDPEYGERIHFMANYEIRALLILPIMFQDLRIGALTVYYRQPRQFQESNTQLGLTLAHTLAIIIQNARLYKRASQRAEEMAALATAAATVSTSLNLEDVLYVVAEQMAKTLNIQSCAISDYDPQTETVTLLTEYGPEDWMTEPEWLQPYDLKQYPITRQVLEKQTSCILRIDNENLDEAERNYMIKAGIKTLLMMPLIVKDQAIGLVELMDDRIERVFTDQEIALGQTLASQAAIAIQNANLYQQLQKYANDLEERVRQRTQELRDAKDYTEGILTSVPDAVFVLDEKNNLIQSNQAGEILLEFAQKNNIELFSKEFLDGLLTSQVPEMQNIIDIQDRSYQARTSFIHLDEGKSHQQIIVFRDVTRFRELDQMKSQFINDISHELRTPLTNLTLYLSLLEMLDSARNPEKQRSYLDILQRETERLTQLIEDLLTISRIESGKIGLQLQSVNVNQIIEDLVQDRAFLATQREIGLKLVPAEELLYALVDPNLLIQAVSNLLTNAVNYTPVGGNITVQTDLERENGRTWVKVDVIDNGVGIHPDEIKFIFERFYRGETSRKMGIEGTGLGLAISREIIIRMGGKISVKSALAKGSTFTIWLRPAISVML